MGKKKGEELRRADEAKRLLDNPLFKEAFITIREELIKHLLNTRVAEEMERDRLYITIKKKGIPKVNKVSTIPKSPPFPIIEKESEYPSPIIKPIG